MQKRGNPTPWIKKAEQDYEAALLKPFLVALNPYAVMFRYPDEHATAAEARRAIVHLRHVRDQLQHVLSRRST